MDPGFGFSSCGGLLFRCGPVLRLTFGLGIEYLSIKGFTILKKAVILINNHCMLFLSLNSAVAALSGVLSYEEIAVRDGCECSVRHIIALIRNDKEPISAVCKVLNPVRYVLSCYTVNIGVK